MITFLKVAVVVMGVLIVGGLAVIGVKIYQDSIKVAETFGDAPAVSEDAPPAALPAALPAAVEHLDLGEGARVQNMIAEGDRLILNVRSPGGAERVVIIDMNSGTVLGDIALEAPR
jgi:hypothetical protein